MASELTKLLKSIYSGKKNIAQSDIENFINKGLLYQPYTVSHDALTSSVKTIYASMKKKHITDAFIKSILSRKLHLRSAIVSYAASRVFPVHTCKEEVCSVCGSLKYIKNFDLNMLNYERYFFAGVQLINPIYIWFDLREFSKTDEDYRADKKDLAAFKNIILAIKKNKKCGIFRNIEKSLVSAFPSNKAEREKLILSFIITGILRSDDNLGFFTEYQTYAKLKENELLYKCFSKNDMSFFKENGKIEYVLDYEVLKYYFSCYEELKDIF